MLVWLKSEHTTVSFIIVGAWNSIFGIGNFLFINFFFSDYIHYLSILIISTILSTIQSHCTQRYLVWQSSQPYLEELLRFFGLGISQFFVNAALLYVFVEFFKFRTDYSQTLLTVLIISISFFISKRFIFKKEVSKYEN